MAKQITRRAFLQSAAVASLGAALGACATPTAESPTQGEEVPKGEATKEIVEIIIAMGEGSPGIIEDAPAHLKEAEATGTRLRFQTVGGDDWGAKQKTLLATGQVPDLMDASPQDIRDFADPKVLTPIMPLIEEHAPNLKRYLEAYPEIERWAMQGTHYLVPVVYFNRPRYAPMPNIRKDWLEALDLPIPDNFDELYQVLTELKKAHPDAYWTNRRGIKRMLMLVAYPMGSGLGGWFRGQDVPYFDEAVDGGKWLYGPIHPEFKDVLAYLAKAYKDGILDPDVATVTQDQWHEKNSSDQGFFVYDNFTFLRRWLAALRENNPEATWAPMPTLDGARGRRQNDFFTFEGGWCIGANSKNPERVIQLLDWLVTPEGIDTSNWGIEGEHYDLTCPRVDSITDYTRAGLGKAQDPKCRVLKPEIVTQYADGGARKSDHGVGLGDLSVLVDGTLLNYWDPPEGDYQQWIDLSSTDPGLHTELIVPPFTKEELERIKDPQANVDTIMNPALDKVVLGQMSLTEFDQAVQDAIKAGAEELEVIYNEAEARMRG
jgi:putative aldouronate transport system substrate-binding protein